MFYKLLCTLVKFKSLNTVIQIINHNTTEYKKIHIIKEIISPDMQIWLERKGTHEMEHYAEKRKLGRAQIEDWI